ncbi:MAG: hypothetical protein ACAI25_19570 [Planctomycetota bacterium]
MRFLKRLFGFGGRDDFDALERFREKIRPTGTTDPYAWLGSDPYAEIRSRFQATLTEQNPTSVLESLRIVGEPRFMTCGREVQHEGRKHMLVTRVGLAFSFEILVVSGPERWPLRGSASFVVAALDQPQPLRQFHFDLDSTLEQTGTMQVLGMRVLTLGGTDPRDGACAWGFRVAPPEG